MNQKTGVVEIREDRSCDVHLFPLLCEHRIWKSFNDACHGFSGHFMKALWYLASWVSMAQHEPSCAFIGFCGTSMAISYINGDWAGCEKVGLTRYLDGTERTVAAGRDGKTAVKMIPWSRPVDHFVYRRHLPSRQENISSWTLSFRPVEKTCRFRPVLPTGSPTYVYFHGSNFYFHGSKSSMEVCGKVH